MTNFEFLQALAIWREIAQQYEAALAQRDGRGTSGQREILLKLREQLKVASDLLQTFDLDPPEQ